VEALIFVSLFKSVCHLPLLLYILALALISDISMLFRLSYQKMSRTASPTTSEQPAPIVPPQTHLALQTKAAYLKFKFTTQYCGLSIMFKCQIG
jgi:hypothetical protein